MGGKLSIILIDERPRDYFLAGFVVLILTCEYMKRIYATILLCSLAIASSAQEEFVEPSRRLTRFEFIQLTGGVILLQGRLDPFPDTLNFILDSGSGGISLDSSTALYFSLKPIPSSRTIRGIGGMRQVSFLNDQTLHLPGLSIDKLNFHINDYDILTTVYGEKIDGIIGYSVFSRYIIKLNYDSSYVEFWTKGDIKYPHGGYMFRPMINTLPVQSARIKDERTVSSRFLFDLGAGLNLMLSTDFLKDSGFLKKKRKFYAKEAEGLGGKVDMKMTVIKEIKLGPYKFHNVPIYVFDDEYNITSYPYLSGIIGNDLLRRFNAIINYGQRQFYLTPNSHFNEPFDYSYSGIELYYINGQIIVGDVAKDSPAEKAGIREGDIVVAVNKNFSQNLSAYKAAIQSGGERLTLFVQRKGQLLKYNFKVKSIL